MKAKEEGKEKLYVWKVKDFTIRRGQASGLYFVLHFNEIGDLFVKNIVLENNAFTQ